MGPFSWFSREVEIQKSVRLQAAKSFYEKHELRFAIGFFLGGFLFDIVTLSDPDDPWNLGKQLLYLGVIFAILARDFLTTYRPTPPKRPAPKWWNHRELLLHFLLGSLLSEYSLFYLKSASLLTSFAFVGTVLALLVANELHSVQQSGFPAKFALFGFCVFS